MGPAPDPAPKVGRVSPKPTTTSSTLNSRSLEAINKRSYPSTTPPAPTGFNWHKETTPVAANIDTKSSVPLTSSFIKSTICQVDYALPKEIYELSTRPASAHRSLKHIKTTLWKADDI